MCDKKKCDRGADDCDVKKYLENKKEVEEREGFATVTIKGEKVTYKERFYRCTNTKDEENEFETGSMADENLFNARNAYRAKHKLR